MRDFLKNYILGYLLMLWYLPRFMLGIFLFMLPGAVVWYPLGLILPSDSKVLADIAGMLVSIFVCSSWEPYRELLERIMPFGPSPRE